MAPSIPPLLQVGQVRVKLAPAAATSVRRLEFPIDLLSHEVGNCSSINANFVRDCLQTPALFVQGVNLQILCLSLLSSVLLRSSQARLRS